VYPGTVVVCRIEVGATAHVEAPGEAETGRAFDRIIQDCGGW
jgi:hypothetical protein